MAASTSAPSAARTTRRAATTEPRLDRVARARSFALGPALSRIEASRSGVHSAATRAHVTVTCVARMHLGREWPTGASRRLRWPPEQPPILAGARIHIRINAT